jgi:hypothetical protein
MTIKTPEQISDEIEGLFNQRFPFLPKSKEYYVTGGVFARLYHHLPIKDVDLFIIRQNDYNMFVNNHFTVSNDFHPLDLQGNPLPHRSLSSARLSATINELEELFDECEDDFELKEAMWMAPGRYRPQPFVTKWLHVPTETKIDIVNIWAEEISPTDFIEQFDFSIVKMFAQYSPAEGRFKVTRLAFSAIDIHLKQLRFMDKLLFGTKSNNTLTRALKWQKLGFSLSEEEYIRMSTKIQEAIIKGVCKKLSPGDVGRLGYDIEEEEKLQVGF